MIVGFVSYAYLYSSLSKIFIGFICISLASMVNYGNALGWIFKTKESKREISDERDPAPVDMTPWPKAKEASIVIVAVTILIYVLLSSIST